MTLLNFHGSSVPFLPDSTEFFQTGQLFLSSSNEQRHGAATSYQGSDSLSTGGCEKPTAPDAQLVKFSRNVSALKSGLQDCSSTSAGAHLSPNPCASYSWLPFPSQSAHPAVVWSLLCFSSCKISCGSS